MPASGLLVVATEVPGVVGVTMPRLSAPGLPDARPDLVVALPARWGSPLSAPGATPCVLAAQVLRLADVLLDVEVAP